MAKEYTVQGRYDFGWEDLTCSDSHKEARASLREYRENDAHAAAHRIVTRRVRYSGPWYHGVTVTRWHDENTTVHALRPDGSPLCGVAYYTTAMRPDHTRVTCKTCARCVD